MDDREPLRAGRAYGVRTWVVLLIASLVVPLIIIHAFLLRWAAPSSLHAALIAVALAVAALAAAFYVGRQIGAYVSTRVHRAAAPVGGERSDAGTALPIRELQPLEDALRDALARVRLLSGEQARGGAAEERALAAARSEGEWRGRHEALEARLRERTAELDTAIADGDTRAARLEALVQELTLADHRERQHVVQLLHSDLQQLLAACRLRVLMLDRPGGASIPEAAGELIRMLDQSLAATRRLAAEIGPPLRGGLAAALEWLARSMKDMHQLAVALKVDPALAPGNEVSTVMVLRSVRELLLNVVKHAGVREAGVEAYCEGACLHIIVADHGCGFDPATAACGGSGLSRVRGRMEFLGGSLRITSAPGQGSRVMMVVPLERRGLSPAPALSAAEQDAAVAAASTDGRRIRVVLVDDHALVRAGLVRLLHEEPDIDVVGEAADGKAALGLVRDRKPDVVVMDVDMPGMDGIEATRLIRGTHPGVRVIGLSMFEESIEGEAIRSAGAAAYLAKSDATDALVTAIRACITGSGSAAHGPD